MLFVDELNIAVVWSSICRATADNLLGIGAKVAANSEDGAVRLICVYTKDFNDKQDVKRVVVELNRLNLLPTDKKRSIYYKCDAYTLLGILSGNPYKLAASLYASKDFLPNASESGFAPAYETETTLSMAGKKRKRLA
jgi:Domain of unknown function (DUF1917)